jgi:hypothetical protein
VKYKTPVAYLNESLNCKKDRDAELYLVQGLVVLSNVVTVSIIINSYNYGVEDNREYHQ